MEPDGKRPAAQGVRGGPFQCVKRGADELRQRSFRLIGPDEHLRLFVIILRFGSGHQRFGNLFGLAPDRLFQTIRHLRMRFQKCLGVFTTLADADRVVGEPGARFLHDPGLDAQIEDFANLGDAFAIHDVEFDLLERRRDLVLDHFHAGRIADNIFAILDLAGAANVEADRGVEFERIAASRSFRIAAPG